ncbi:TetR/AcrR family transcriptional regulator [Actinomadura rugatobispora]|uniref:TetR/AcrR family transcriptional regulator n=1 Tax=Actinomadura rugatobispora TaxID=1994 RepID=A0ABW1AJC6_9ACTN|nr:TetR/AcrR family transcriptional regulator [Actinomadura rugatobispora]
MASPRRIGSPEAKNRTVLLDAAERLMLEEGYAAVSSRRVAEKAGLKPQLVHYYFRTMDELFLEMFRRRAEEGLRRQAQALASSQPLRALWEYSTDSAGTAFTMEFAALANHRKELRAQMARYAEQFRREQVEGLSEVLGRYGIDTREFPPLVLMVVMTSLSRVLVMEDALGLAEGHEETEAFVERWLGRLEGESVPRDQEGRRPV